MAGVPSTSSGISNAKAVAAAAVQAHEAADAATKDHEKATAAVTMATSTAPNDSDAAAAVLAA